MLVVNKLLFNLWLRKDIYDINDKLTIQRIVDTSLGKHFTYRIKIPSIGDLIKRPKVMEANKIMVGELSDLYKSLGLVLKKEDIEKYKQTREDRVNQFLGDDYLFGNDKKKLIFDDKIIFEIICTKPRFKLNDSYSTLSDYMRLLFDNLGDELKTFLVSKGYTSFVSEKIQELGNIPTSKLFFTSTYYYLFLELEEIAYPKDKLPELRIRREEFFENGQWIVNYETNAHV